uniref:Interleukin-13, Interleukin-13 receptor subunit alpha-2, receptor, decoy, decoy receptor n=1 Tax=Phage sp. ctWVj20 TaxID=2826748 RepID=A0A8S5NSG6_9VIRU|nr:MAG TPA: Interleukin-13, Interleukin-13 receptor subunit alpha-2, receptor, decoy, decoy receptor [Phage sp. ctWVj20]
MYTKIGSNKNFIFIILNILTIFCMFNIICLYIKKWRKIC